MRQLPRRTSTRMRPSGLPTDQYAKYWSSVHGQRSIAAQRRPGRRSAPTATASHDIKKVSDPTCPVVRRSTSRSCAPAATPTRSGWSRTGSRPTSSTIYAKSVHGGRSWTTRTCARRPARPATGPTTRSRPRRRRWSRSAASATPRRRSCTRRAGTRSWRPRPRSAGRATAPTTSRQPSSKLFFHPEQPELHLQHLPRPATRTRCGWS